MSRTGAVATKRSRSPHRFALALVAVAVLGAGAGAAFGDSGGHPVDEESPAMRPVGRAVPFASGTAATGDSWTAVKYPTAGGLVCVDIQVTGPSTQGRTQVAGGCFDRVAPVTQRGRAIIGGDGATVAFGLLEGSSLASSGARSVTVTFNSGQSVDAVAADDGVFVTAGAGLPTGLSYRASSGQLWTHVWGDGRPRTS